MRNDRCASVSRTKPPPIFLLLLLFLRLSFPFRPLLRPRDGFWTVDGLSGTQQGGLFFWGGGGTRRELLVRQL